MSPLKTSAVPTTLWMRPCPSRTSLASPYSLSLSWSVQPADKSLTWSWSNYTYTDRPQKGLQHKYPQFLWKSVGYQEVSFQVFTMSYHAPDFVAQYLKLHYVAISYYFAQHNSVLKKHMLWLYVTIFLLNIKRLHTFFTFFSTHLRPACVTMSPLRRFLKLLDLWTLQCIIQTNTWFGFFLTT